MNIKLANKNDIESIISISKTSAYISLTKENINYYINNEYHKIYILNNNNENCAFIILFIIDNVVDIIDFIVSKKHKRKGFGNALLKYSIKETFAKKITLDLHENNTPALSFYESFGFNIIARRENYYEKPTKGDSLIMELNIK